MSKIRRRAALVAAVAATTSAGLLAWTMIATVANAAVAGCQVTYAVPSQWGGGFTANIRTATIPVARVGRRITMTSHCG